MTNEQQQEKFESWAVLELFGHQKIAGLVSEATIGGYSFVRVDVPEVDGQAGYTKFYGNGAIYCLTPTSEEVARAVALHHRPKPIQSWELPKPKQGSLPGVVVDAEYPDPDDEDYEDERSLPSEEY